MSQTVHPREAGLEPGRRVVALGAAATLAVTALDVLLVGELSLFFDLCFVAICLGVAAAARPEEFFVVAVLPPLLMVGLFALLGVAAPGVVADPGDGVVQAVVAGLAHHSAALLAGYAVCLGCLAVRLRSAR